MRKNKKKQIILYIVLLLMFLGLGYAFLNTSLLIDGTTSFRANEWNVYIDENSFSVLPGSVSGAKVISAPSISEDTISFRISLTEPGDYYAYTFDVVNDGSIDAMIGNVDGDYTTTGDSNFLRFLNLEARYAYGLGYKTHDRIRANSRTTIMMWLRYKNAKELSPNYLPTVDSTLNINVTFRFVQADSTANDPAGVIYRVSDEELQEGDDMPPALFETDDKGARLIDHYNTVYALRHQVNDAQITSSGIAYFKESSNDPGLYTIYELYVNDYAHSVTTMNQIFTAQTECSLESDANDTWYQCTKNGVRAIATQTGSIAIVEYDAATDNYGRYCVVLYDSSTGKSTSGCSGFS
ncbi:MAG: hypothetical protein IKF71_04705 [Bacilli bacterium]|nr:hypothetical protein [Bacilli bacterium]